MEESPKCRPRGEGEAVVPSMDFQIYICELDLTCVLNINFNQAEVIIVLGSNQSKVDGLDSIKVPRP